MDYLEIAPPIIRLVLEENLSAFDNPRDFSQSYKTLFPELRRQSKWSLDNYRYIDHPDSSGLPKGLIVTSSGGLNPLSQYAVCHAPRCRAAVAKSIAQTLGLYADVITGSEPDLENATEILKIMLPNT